MFLHCVQFLAILHCYGHAQSLWDCGSGPNPDAIQTKYQQTADKIRNYLQNGSARDEALQRLAFLGDTFGHRLVGSISLDNSIDYLVDQLTREGFAVHTEPFTTYNWSRKNEYAELRSPYIRTLAILGLGFTDPTAPSGVSAEAIVVTSFDELTHVNASGKIVVFNQPWLGYPDSSNYRYDGASQAAKRGAVAALVRSAASFSINSPHTGMQWYEDGVPRIPVASITVEDAEMLHRMYLRGTKLEIYLKIDSQTVGNITQRQVIVDYPGASLPNEIVMIGGHLDSWDVGQGVMDDGSGVIISWEALTVLRKLHLRPRRTIRAIFWNAEEQGHIGSKAYYEAHKDDTHERYVYVSESDSGAFKPNGLYFNGNTSAQKTMQQILQLLAPINATELLGTTDCGDANPWVENQKIPGAWLENKALDDYYFMFHHSHGDTVSVYQNTVHKNDLDLATILWATVAYVVADLEPTLCDNTPKSSAVNNHDVAYVL